MWLITLIIIIVAIFLALEIREEIDWLYRYISRCELRIEELEKEKRYE